MFSLFKKTEPSIPYVDKVWKRSEYARKGLVMLALRRIQMGKSCLIVGFFDSEIKLLKTFLGEHNLSFIDLVDDVGATPMQPSIYVVNASNSLNSKSQDFLRSNASIFLGEVFFLEHHPMVIREQEFLKQLTLVGFTQFVFCISFEDPLLQFFKTQSILPLLKQLGLEEEEAIEHAMVTKAIQRAREKLVMKSAKEIPAQSSTEWFDLNLKK